MKNNVLSKSEFVRMINAIRESYDFQMELVELGTKYNVDVPTYDDLSGYLLEALNRMFDLPVDDYVGSDIDYFCFEINFGRDYKEGCITVDEEPVDISTAEKLYDWITRNEQ